VYWGQGKDLNSNSDSHTAVTLLPLDSPPPPRSIFLLIPGRDALRSVSFFFIEESLLRKLTLLDQTFLIHFSFLVSQFFPAVRFTKSPSAPPLNTFVDSTPPPDRIFQRARLLASPPYFPFFLFLSPVFLPHLSLRLFAPLRDFVPKLTSCLDTLFFY